MPSRQTPSPAPIALPERAEDGYLLCGAESIGKPLRHQVPGAWRRSKWSGFWKPKATDYHINFMPI